MKNRNVRYTKSTFIVFYFRERKYIAQHRIIAPFKLETPSYRILIINYIFFRKNAARCKSVKKKKNDFNTGKSQQQSVVTSARWRNLIFSD